MAPKKEKLSKERLRDLIEESQIIFEGPAPPKTWPTHHKHHFHVIREIWANRYDEYKIRADIDSWTIETQRSRVKRLRNKAYRLRKDVNINENTWRDLVETFVIERFGAEIVCDRCKNEKWESDYQAYPLAEDEKVKLERKRARRRQCSCHQGGESIENVLEDSDEGGQSSIFAPAVGAEVSHDPNDRFEKLSISMHPDRIVGLSMTDRYRKYIASCPPELTHFPVNGRRLLYPFLIVEAKRENDAPGFKSVEAQTAFPLRRLLKVQDNLRIARRIDLNPLVWFFAFQGEEWRLYAGTLEDSKVVRFTNTLYRLRLRALPTLGPNKRQRVFDLWHGTIESHDGALQLLQIVDFIWTWARDIYRPQIRRCLRGHGDDLRGLSPTSTNPFTRSQSVLSQSSFQPLSHGISDAIQENSVIAPESNGHFNIQDASSHPFLRLGNSCDISAPWAIQTSIRHSDIVAFSFRVLQIPENEVDFHSLIHLLQYDAENLATMLHLLALTQQSQYSIPLSRGHIYELEKDWTGADRSAPNTSNTTNSSQMIRAFFFFRTFFQSDDWQIKREVCCIVWSWQAAKLVSKLAETDVDLYHGNEGLQSIQHCEIIRAFPQVRNLSGKNSVAYALRRVNLILSHCKYPSGDGGQLQWALPRDQGITEAAIARYSTLFNATCGAGMSQFYHHQSVRLLRVLQTGPATEILTNLPPILKDMGKVGAILTIKPSYWPPHCPRFCLFVLLESGFDHNARLGCLLHSTIKEREWYGGGTDVHQEQLSLCASDRGIIKAWMNAMPREL